MQITSALDLLRGVVRPLVTLALVACVIYCIWMGQDIPTELHQLNIISLGFWYGERAARNFITTKAAANGGH